MLEHRKKSEDSNLKQNDAASLGNHLPVFQRNIMPASSRVYTSRKNHLHHITQECFPQTHLHNLIYNINKPSSFKHAKIMNHVNLFQLTETYTLTCKFIKQNTVNTLYTYQMELINIKCDIWEDNLTLPHTI